MNESSLRFFDKLEALCTLNNNEDVWTLATTPSGVPTQPTAQLAFSQFGRLGLEFILAWNHIRTLNQRDNQAIALAIRAFMSSHTWVNALICDERALNVSTGLGRNSQLSNWTSANKQCFSLAALGAGLYSNTIGALNIALDTFSPYYANAAASANVDPKSRLQSFAQSIKHNAPKYSVVAEEGPDHDKCFRVSVTIPSTPFTAEGRGPSKKAAEKDAAASLLNLRGVSSRIPPVQGPLSLSSPNNRLDEAGIAARRRRSQVSMNGHFRQPPRLHTFITFFKEQTGVELPPDFAEIAVTHLSATSSISEVDLRDYGYYGLGLLGSHAYLFAIASILFGELDADRLSDRGLPAHIGEAIYTLGTQGYKGRVAKAWSVHVRADRKIHLSLPDSIVLEAFNRSLGAAVLLDLTNVELLANYLRDQIAADIDFPSATVEVGVSTAARNIASTQIQLLSRMFLREKLYFGPNVFAFQVAGPSHSQQFTCNLIGDVNKQLSGIGPTKAAANRLACDRLLSFICSRILTNTAEATPIGVAWVDAIIDSMRRSLLEEPDEAVWLAVQFDKIPLHNREFWKAVKDAIHDPLAASNTALASIKAATELSAAQSQRLSAFVLGRFAERAAAQPIRIVELSLNGLFREHQEVAPNQVIGVLCSCLHLLKCLDRPTRDWVSLPDLIASVLCLLSPDGHTKVAVPAKLVYVDFKLISNVLQQIRLCSASSGDVRVDVGEESLSICGDFTSGEIGRYEPLMLAAWSLCQRSVCGFAVSRTKTSFVIDIALSREVSVTKRGVCQVEIEMEGPSSPSRQLATISPQVEAVRTTLHEIKNRVIALPTSWKEELRGCAMNLAKVAEVLRAPHLERCSLGQVYDLIKDTVKIAGSTYGAEGTVDVIHEEDVGYFDVAMIKSIFANLADNAARAASAVPNGEWHIEGVVSATEIDVTVANTCCDPQRARANIDAGGSLHSANVLSTGLGITTAKRLAGKLLGNIKYDYSEGQVLVNVVLPVDLGRVSWLLEGS